MGLAARGCFKAFLDETFLAAFDGTGGAADSLGDLGDRPAGSVGAAVAEQEHAGGEEFPGVAPAQRFEVVAFSLGQGDSIAGWGWHKTFSDNFDSNMRAILRSRVLGGYDHGKLD